LCYAWLRIAGQSGTAQTLTSTLFQHLRILGTIWDDDRLTGSSGQDWFILTGNDKATDLSKNDEAG